MHFLALDIGSSFIKGAVLDVEKLTIEHVTRVPFPEPIAGLPPGYFEIDPRLIIAAVEEILYALAIRVPDCVGILVSSQMGGVILTEPGGTNPTNYISWRDQRTAIEHWDRHEEYLDAVRRTLGDERVRELGNELRAGSALAILFWLKCHENLPKCALPLPLGEFVLQQLSGGVPPTIDPTLALSQVDLTNNNWSIRAFETLGLKFLQWPKLGNIWDGGGVCKIAGLDIAFFSSIGDHQAALAGALLQDGELSINISTGSQISLLTDRFVPGNYQTRPYLDGRFLNTLTHLPAGRSLDVLVNLVNKPWPEIVKAAEAAPDTDLAANLTFFEGPLGSRGSISNITTENLSVGTLFRAAFRNMAENYATCAARLSPEKSWDRIVFSGGLAQKLPLLREFILEKLPGESRLCSSAEDTLLGLLVISQVISGRAKNLQEASLLVSAAQAG
jgi:sugar (pentulose or hexulose) kinase